MKKGMKLEKVKQHLKKYRRFRIGLRTIKTAVAVIFSMMIVTSYGATTSRLIFAMLGAMAAMEHSFKESLESCLTQIVGMILGALAGVLLLRLPLPELLVVGIGIVFVITLYNAFRIRYSPSLPCLIVVILCTTPDIQPFTYAIGRLWDTAIGLGIGMLINVLIFPYDNSSRMRRTAECLDKEVIYFLEDMFDGDNHLPDAENMIRMIDELAHQLEIFSKQWLLLYLRQKKRQLDQFRLCEGKARQLSAEMVVLCQMNYPGRLSEENRRRLLEYGAEIKDERKIDEAEELDVVTNYHVTQLLNLREELIEALQK